METGCSIRIEQIAGKKRTHINTYILKTIESTFDEKMIVTNVNKMTKTYSVNDILPSQSDAGGLISVNLYAGAQDTWTERCRRNHVPIDIPVFDAIKQP